MMEKIIDLIKGQVMKTVGAETGIPEEKKAETVETTTASLIDGLKKYATPENLSSLKSMLGMGQTHEAAATAQSADMASGLESNVVNALTSKVGLSSSVAQKIATAVIPAVMSLFKKKAGDSDSGFDIGSMLSSLTGKKGEGSSVMDTIGSIFGGKDR